MELCLWLHNKRTGKIQKQIGKMSLLDWGLGDSQRYFFTNSLIIIMLIPKSAENYADIQELCNSLQITIVRSFGVPGHGKGEMIVAVAI